MDLIVSGRQVKASIVKGRASNSVSAKFLSPHELELTIPWKMSALDAPKFLEQHKTWLERAYKRFLGKRGVFSGGSVLVNGEYLKVEFVESPERTIEKIGSSLFIRTDNVLELKAMLASWLETQTREYLASKTEVFKRFGVQGINVKHSEHRWGFCTSKRRITFHPFLSALPERLREYLLYHEIAHLFELNHSWRYKARLEELVPDFKERERELKQYSL
jgi:predicted metal-dependent hydrolase